MCLARFFECAVRKIFAVGIAVLLVTAVFAQDATPPSSQSSAPTMTPMPQAPAPQHNAHLYSDKDYSKPAAAFPNVLAPYTIAQCAAAESEQFRAHRSALPRWQNLSIHQRRGGDGAGE